MPNFVELGRTVAGIWPFSIFQDGGCPPSWIFKSWEMLTAHTLRGAKNASSCQILCRSVEPLRRYGRFRFFKMAAVRHLGFVIRLFGPSTKCILVVSDTVQNLVSIGAVVSIICKF